MPQRESPADGALHVDPGPDMDPALASLLETLQGKLRDIVSKSATFAATTTDEEGTYTSEREHAKRAILTCDKNASEWFQKERARMLASTMSADDKKELSSILDDDGPFYRVMVLEAKEKLNRAVETLDQKPST
jgi:ABC-type tungstate transport system permease subunit